MSPIYLQCLPLKVIEVHVVRLKAHKFLVKFSTKCNSINVDSSSTPSLTASNALSRAVFRGCEVWLWYKKFTV